MAAQWDGLHGIITNIRHDAATALISRYARLWIIEKVSESTNIPWKCDLYSINARKIYKAFELERSLDATIYPQ